MPTGVTSLTILAPILLAELVILALFSLFILASILIWCCAVLSCPDLLCSAVCCIYRIQFAASPQGPLHGALHRDLKHMHAPQRPWVPRLDICHRGTASLAQTPITQALHHLPRNLSLRPWITYPDTRHRDTASCLLASTTDHRPCTPARSLRNTRLRDMLELVYGCPYQSLSEGCPASAT